MNANTPERDLIATSVSKCVQRLNQRKKKNHRLSFFAALSFVLAVLKEKFQRGAQMELMEVCLLTKWFGGGVVFIT